MKTNIIDVIRARKIEKEQAKNGKHLVKDAYFLADENQEFWAGYLNPNNDYEQKKIGKHNYYLAFHNAIWKSLEPNEKLAALIYLERDIITNKKDKFTPNNEGRFTIVNNDSDDYFCKRENGINTYYINMRLFADEFLESYAFVYALYYMHIEAKAQEALESFEKTKKIADEYKHIALNFKNRISKTQSYEKFLLGEGLSKAQKAEVNKYLNQPIEKQAKLNLEKIEDLAFNASNNATGLAFEDIEWKYYLEDQKLMNRDEQELMDK